MAASGASIKSASPTLQRLIHISLLDCAHIRGLLVDPTRYPNGFLGCLKRSVFIIPKDNLPASFFKVRFRELYWSPLTTSAPGSNLFSRSRDCYHPTFISEEIITLQAPRSTTLTQATPSVTSVSPPDLFPPHRSDQDLRA